VMSSARGPMCRETKESKGGSGAVTRV
jgi:hypothetical protein